MIEYSTGSIFDSSAECLVNPVNCVGVMGKGLALEFKKRYPMYFQHYKNQCSSKLICPGFVDLWKDDKVGIVSFPTKDHWKKGSKLDYIILGLLNLEKLLVSERIDSIALPALGCGLGGLPWGQVKHYLELSFKDNPVEATVYLPREKGSPTSQQGSLFNIN